MGFLNNLKSIIGGTDSPSSAQSPTSTPLLKKVLIVEDDKDIRDFYFRLLNTEGFEAIVADNGQIGYDMTVAQKPDIILLDLMMPIMDGKAMLHKIRELPEFKKTPVVILSNAGDADSIRQTKLFDNANDFLIKANTTPEEIVQKIKSYL